MKDSYRLGYNSRLELHSENPYEKYTKSHAEFQKGYWDCDYDLSQLKTETQLVVIK